MSEQNHKPLKMSIEAPLNLREQVSRTIVSTTRPLEPILTHQSAAANQASAQTRFPCKHPQTSALTPHQSHKPKLTYATQTPSNNTLASKTTIASCGAMANAVLLGTGCCQQCKLTLNGAPCGRAGTKLTTVGRGRWGVA